MNFYVYFVSRNSLILKIHLLITGHIETGLGIDLAQGRCVPSPTETINWRRGMIPHTQPSSKGKPTEVLEPCKARAPAIVDRRGNRQGDRYSLELQNQGQTNTNRLQRKPPDQICYPFPANSGYIICYLLCCCLVLFLFVFLSMPWSWAFWSSFTWSLAVDF